MYLVRPPYILKKLYPEALWRVETHEKKIYLTFDDGPVPLITPWVLDLLKEKNIKATFFCVGENVSNNPEIFQRILNEGHKVGNHTFNHLNGWNAHTTEYIENIKKCGELVQSRLFRPPYGKLKKSQSAILRKHFKIVMWDVLSGDYDKNTTPEKCFQNVVENVRTGSLIVFHDSYKAEEKMRYALPLFIDHALKNKFTFELL